MAFFIVEGRNSRAKSLRVHFNNLKNNNFLSCSFTLLLIFSSYFYMQLLIFYMRLLFYDKILPHKNRHADQKLQSRCQSKATGVLHYLRCLGLHVANYCIVYSLYGLLNQSNQDLFTHCHCHCHCRWLLISPCRHSNSPDFTGSLPKFHAISWSPDFYQILPIFQNIQEIS